MSESTSENQPVGPGSKSTSRGGFVRKLILYSVLGVMLAALFYDYRYARPAVSKAYDAIVEASRRANADPNDTLTKEDVAKLLGKQPIDTFNDGVELVEVYGWTSGIPGRPHKLYTVFKPHGMDHLFYRHAKFSYETSLEVAPIAGRVVGEDLSDEERAALELSYDSELAAEMNGVQSNEPPADDASVESESTAEKAPSSETEADVSND